jgi:hypothetical protein
MIGGVLAPAAILSVLLSRSARRRIGRVLLVAREGVAGVRDDWFGEFTLEEFLTGAVAKRPRR